MTTTAIVRTMLLGVALIAAPACSGSDRPTSPTPMPTEPFPSTFRLSPGETRTVTPMGLRITFERVEPPLDLSRVLCQANAPCGPWGPSAWLLMRVPERDEQRSPLFYRQPAGADRIAYGGHLVRLIRFEPEWEEGARDPRQYVGVFEVFLQ